MPDPSYQEGYDNGYVDGVASVNTSACEQDFTQADLNEKYQEGFDDGVASVDVTGCEDCPPCADEDTGITLSPELNMHVPMMRYNTLLGDLKLWGNFEFAPGENGELLWKLTEYGEVE